MTLAENLKTTRQKLLLTQEELAKELNVSLSTVNRWETGKARPKLSTMKTIKLFCKIHNLPYGKIESGWLNYNAEDDK